MDLAKKWLLDFHFICRQTYSAVTTRNLDETFLISYYGTFSIYIKLFCNLVQPGPGSSSHLKMAAKSMPQRMQAVVDAERGHTKY